MEEFELPGNREEEQKEFPEPDEAAEELREPDEADEAEEAEEAEETEKGGSIGADIYEWARTIASAMLIIILVYTFVVRVMGVQGPSMIPTLQNGDRLLVLDATLVREYRQGDVVIARKQSFSDDPIVKRVIAVGGQTVDIDFTAGIVYVDGVALSEPYVNDLTYTFEGTEFPLTVPEGSVFLMGDNRNRSTDSREPRIGAVDTRYLIGKAILIVYPGPDSVTNKRDFSRIGTIRKG